MVILKIKSYMAIALEKNYFLKTKLEKILDETLLELLNITMLGYMNLITKGSQIAYFIKNNF